MGAFQRAEPHRRVVDIVFGTAVIAAAVAWLMLAHSDGPQLGLIPTLIGVAGVKFFGRSKGDQDQLGDHPAVAYFFKALATGEMDDAEDIVADDFKAYANGYLIDPPSGAKGAAQFRENIEFWRSTVPDLSVDLYDEVSQKEPDKTDGIALRYVVSGTFPAGSGDVDFHIEAAAFVKVVDRMITEWRVIVDPTFLEQARATEGLPTPG